MEKLCWWSASPTSYHTGMNHAEASRRMVAGGELPRAFAGKRLLLFYEFSHVPREGLLLGRKRNMTALLHTLRFLVMYIVPCLCVTLFLCALASSRNHGFNFQFFLPFLAVGLVVSLARLFLDRPDSWQGALLNICALAVLFCAMHFNIMISDELWQERGQPAKFSLTSPPAAKMAPARPSGAATQMP